MLIANRRNHKKIVDVNHDVNTSQCVTLCKIIVISRGRILRQNVRRNSEIEAHKASLKYGKTSTNDTACCVFPPAKACLRIRSHGRK